MTTAKPFWIIDVDLVLANGHVDQSRWRILPRAYADTTTPASASTRALKLAMLDMRARRVAGRTAVHWFTLRAKFHRG